MSEQSATPGDLEGRPLQLPSVEWAGDSHFAAFDKTVRVRCRPRPAAATIATMFARFPGAGPVDPPDTFTLLDPTPDDPLYRLYRGSYRSVGYRAWAHVVNKLVAQINIKFVKAYPQHAVHAGVVAWQGKAVCFPGWSGRGKSTMVAACLLEGMAYVSDEALLLDFNSALALPYPKPIGVSAWSRRAVGLPATAEHACPVRESGPCRWDLPFPTAEELGAVTVDAPLPVGHVVLLDRNSERPAISRLAANQVQLALLQQSVNHYRHPAESFRVTARIAQTARAWSLAVGDDPRGAARLLAKALSA